MRVILVELVTWALAEESYQMLYIASVGVRPYIIRVIRRDGLERYERKQFFPGKKFDHFTKLEGVARWAGIITKGTLSIS